METTDILDFLRQKLKPNRLKHVLSVRDTAASIAPQYGVDQQQIELAALLHDCAKWMTDGELLTTCQRHQIVPDLIEEQNPSLLHAKVGATLASDRFGIVDRSVLQAVSVHTTGMAKMSTLDKVLFVADYCEPNRSYPAITEVRKLAPVDLNRAAFEVARQKLERQLVAKQMLHPQSVTAFNDLLTQIS